VGSPIFMLDEMMLALSPPESPQVAEPEVAGPEVAEPATAPRVDDGGTQGLGLDYRVLLYNDEVHSVGEVIEQVVKATGCSPLRAEAITLEVDARGRAVCFRGERARCQDVCRVLREINLQCEVDCD